MGKTSLGAILLMCSIKKYKMVILIHLETIFYDVNYHFIVSAYKISRFECLSVDIHS